MKTSTESNSTTVAAVVAGEDVACGDFVALLNTTCEVPSYMWDAGPAMLPIEELVRLRMIPSDAGVPLKVFGICLPFLYVKNSGGQLKTLDLRRQQIVRLDRACAKEVWDELKPVKKN
jgi:hypothetical protein